MNSIKEVFDTLCGDLKVDKKLLNEIRAFRIGFVNKNGDHIDFFGGHLTGVHSIKFTNADYFRWFNEIVQVDEALLRETLHNLPTVDKQHKVASNPLYLSCLWLAHKFYNSTILNQEQRTEGIIETFLVMNFRFITQLHKKYFKFPARREVAEAAHAELSMKFRLKADGNWLNSLEVRSNHILEKYEDVIKRFDDDKKIGICLSDAQGRINNRLKNITGVFRDIHRAGKTMKSVSDTMGFDGANILRDRVNSVTLYKQYVLSALIDERTFIKEEIMDVVMRILPAVPEKHFRVSLEWLVKNYGNSKGAVIETVVDELLTHSFTYLARNKSLVTGSVDLVSLLSNLRGIYTSSRTKEDALIKLRHDIEGIVETATGIHNKNNLAAIRTAVMLYIITRAYTRNHYS